ncbi:MAG: S8 family peptidase [Acidobacteria bacterium]|nr:S8 family peptidase [Acidobacteriota bacterium]
MCRDGRTVLLTAAILMLLPAPGWGQAAPNTLDPVLRARARQLTGRSRVIVQFRDGADVRAITDYGGLPGRRLSGGGAQVADVDHTALTRLAADPRVRRVAVDRAAFGTLERTGAAIGAALAREELGFSGEGVGVAIIDSGITTWHDDLYLAGDRAPRADRRVVHFRDFTRETSPRQWASEPSTDDYGHGTHVAGIIAGNGFDSSGARAGVAPKASLIGLKVLDADGHGYVSDVIAAIDYAIAIKDVYNIRVMNVSVAAGVFESYQTDPLAQAARRAVEAGIVVVAAAGNLGATTNGATQYGGITCPGNAPWVLTVGAASHEGTRPRSNDIIARFSSRGPTWIDREVKPDLVAPGVGIESLSDSNSTLYWKYSDYLLDGTRPGSQKAYLSLSGTSMAAPVVAGTVALMLDANPALTPNAVKAILQYTAEERDGEPYFAQGAGLLNARGALRLAQFFREPRQGFPEPGDAIEREWIAWSQEIVWGNGRYAGGWPLPGSNAWSLDVEWGVDAAPDGKPIVWGVEYGDQDSIIWGTEYDDDSIIWGTSYEDDSIIWGTGDTDDSIIWGTSYDDSIIWGTSYEDDSIIWGTAVTPVLWPAEQPVDNRRRNGSARH